MRTKRTLLVLVGAGLALGGAAAAWAGPRGPSREVAKACRVEAREEHPGADPATLREAVVACLEAAGVDPAEGRELTPEQEARREALRACLRGVTSANPDADKAELRDLAQPCFEQAGITPGRRWAKRAAARQCRAELREAHPDLDGASTRPLVKECVQAK